MLGRRVVARVKDLKLRICWHQSSAHKGSQQTPTITRLAPCFRLLQGARLLVLPTRDPSNPDNHSFGSVSSGVYYSCKKEARENKKSCSMGIDILFFFTLTIIKFLMHGDNCKSIRQKLKRVTS
eukprot:g54559.t1